MARGRKGGVLVLAATGPLEVFAGANSYLRPGPPRYVIRHASLHRRDVVTSSGLRLHPDADLGTAKAPDTLVVPGGDGTRGAQPELLRRLSALVQVDPEPIFVRDGNVYTSAGVTAGIDLALALVEDDLGRDTALLIARHLVMFLRRPGNQSQFSAQLRGQVAQRESLREVQQWIADRPGADLSVESLARRAGLSPRHFARAFRTETGTTPGRYVDLTRIESARRLLTDGTDGIDQIARACGYGVAETMRRAFHRELGVSPAEYRRRF